MTISRKGSPTGLQPTTSVPRESPEIAETQTDAIHGSKRKVRESTQSSPDVTSKPELSAKEAGKIRYEHRLSSLTLQTDLRDAVPIERGQKGLSAESKSTPNISHKHVYQHDQTDLEFQPVPRKLGFEVWCEDTKLSEKREAGEKSNTESKKKEPG